LEMVSMTDANPVAETILTEDPFLEDPAVDLIGDPFSEQILDPPADPNASDFGAATGMPGPERPFRKRRADMTPEERRASNQERKRREVYKKAKQAEQHESLQQQLHQAGFVAVEVPGGGCLVQTGPGGEPSWQTRLQRPYEVPAPRSAARVSHMGQPQLGGDMRWPQLSGLGGDVRWPQLGGDVGGPRLAAPGTRKRKLRSDMTPEEKKADNAERRARAAAKQAAQAVGAGLPIEAGAAGIAHIGLTAIAPAREAGAEEPQWLA